MRLKLMLRQELDVLGGASQSIFPRTENKLKRSDYQEALKYVAKRKRMERYHSVMDFLFCEIFTSYRFHAFKYYNNKGPLLKDLPEMTPQVINAFDLVLCDLILELCIQCYKRDLRFNWSQFRNEYLKVATISG